MHALVVRRDVCVGGQVQGWEFVVARVHQSLHLGASSLSYYSWSESDFLAKPLSSAASLQILLD